MTSPTANSSAICISANHPHQRPRLKLLDPDSDQVARDVVAFGEIVECLARNEVQGGLSFELNAMCAVSGAHSVRGLKLHAE